ncbi:hypothetical protein V2I01_17635 [Micromonospora sp. BRA006-A]|nr:hypothetical protein [Micromonospora sp. BRA006-A]
MADIGVDNSFMEIGGLVADPGRGLLAGQAIMRLATAWMAHNTACRRVFGFCRQPVTVFYRRLGFAVRPTPSSRHAAPYRASHCSSSTATSPHRSTRPVDLPPRTRHTITLKEKLMAATRRHPRAALITGIVAASFLLTPTTAAVRPMAIMPEGDGCDTCLSDVTPVETPASTARR